MKIRALINLVVSSNKEVLKGQEYDLNESDAKDLIERGFAESVQKTQTNTQSKNPPQTLANKGKASSPVPKNNEQTDTPDANKPQGDDDDTTPDQGNQQPV